MSLSTRDSLERIVITFDFTSVQDAISSTVVTITEKDQDANIASMMIDVPQVIGNKVLQLFTGGETGYQYTVKCLVNIAATGEKFMAKDTLTVKA